LREIDLTTHAPFESHEDLYATIDSSTLGDILWQCLVTRPDNIDEHSLNWMRTHYKVWYHDPEAVVSIMLSNPDFDGQFDLCPYINLDAYKKCQWNNVMSGNIAWQRSMSISVSSVLRMYVHGAAHRIISLHLTQIPKD
jgi:hypothetical protein